MLLQAAIVLSIYNILPADALQCTSEDGESIDWGFIYKIPLSKDSQNELIKKGVAYMYMNSAQPHWTLSKLGVDDDNSLMAKHVKIFLERKDEISYLAYNDILPPPFHGKESKTAGHTRGLIMADMDGGVWATSTLPGYPGPEPTYTYPEGGKAHGEFFTCVVLDLKTLDRVGTSLQIREAQIYASKIIPGMESSLPKLLSVSKGGKPNSAPWYQVNNLKSRAGLPIITFSKSKEFQGDLYKDLIAPNLKNDILVRSVKEENGLPSNCTGDQKVKNVQTVSIQELGMTISDVEDNAKWTVSESSTGQGWLCFGDMDRNEADRHKGGGATCLYSKSIAGIFRDMASSIEECP